MTYAELREHITQYHCEHISRRELLFAIALWQYSGRRR